MALRGCHNSSRSRRAALVTPARAGGEAAGGSSPCSGTARVAYRRTVAAGLGASRGSGWPLDSYSRPTLAEGEGAFSMAFSGAPDAPPAAAAAGSAGGSSTRAEYAAPPEAGEAKRRHETPSSSDT